MLPFLRLGIGGPYLAALERGYAVRHTDVEHALALE